MLCPIESGSRSWIYWRAAAADLLPLHPRRRGCDGEAWHSGEDKIRQDMERQAILERIGWKFVRVRGSEYYRNPEKAMEHVVSELTKLEIMPESNTTEPKEQTSSELVERMKIRANQILDNERGTGESGTMEFTMTDAIKSTPAVAPPFVAHSVKDSAAPSSEANVKAQSKYEKAEMSLAARADLLRSRPANAAVIQDRKKTAKPKRNKEQTNS